MKAQDLEKLNRPPACIIYGPAGGGKTGLVSQAAGSYLFDFDRGMRTALTIKDKFTPLRQSIEFDEFFDEDVMRPVRYMQAKQKLLEMASEVNAGRSKYDGIVVDSLTGLCRSAQLYCMSLGSKNVTGYSLGVPKIQDYGIIVNEVEAVLTILRSMRCLVLVTAHEMLVEAGDENRPNAAPEVFTHILSATKPHGENKIPWLFDEVLHTITRPIGQGRNAYLLTGQRTPKIIARTRSGIGETNFGELGLYGLLKLMSYDYAKAKIQETKP